MNRVLILTLAVLAVMFTCVNPAAARAFALDPIRTVAMTEQHMYWIQKGTSNCRDCRKLWREDLATGKRSVVFALRHGFLDDLKAGARSVAFTVKRPGREYRTSIRVLDEARGLSELASTTYYPRRTSNCGAQIGVGGISSAGEVAWSIIEFTGRVEHCTFFPEFTEWSVYAASSTGHSRKVLAPSQVESIGVGFRSGLSGGIVSVKGFDGRRLLVFVQEHGTLMYDTLTGNQASYEPRDSALFEEGLSLSGAVTAMSVEYSGGESKQVGLLFPNPMDPNTALPLRLTDYKAQALKPCGSRSVQLGTKKRSAILVVRDAAGAVLSTRVMKLPANVGFYALDCNSTLALLRYGLVNSDDELTTSRSRTFTIG